MYNLLIFLNTLYSLGYLHTCSACAYFPRINDLPLSDDGYLNEVPDFQYSFARDEIDGFLAPVKYHPTAFLQKYTVMKSSLNSACMKCGICLAVAEKLEDILQFALKSSISLYDFDGYLSSQLLRPICEYAFESYGLKEWNGLRVFSSYSFLDSVPNALEGHWWQILRDSCHFYLNHFGDGNLVKAWLLESQNTTSLLCRNDGLFRDCMNIEQNVLTIPFPQRFLFPANQIKITYPCA